MANLLIVAHAPLASALLAVARHAFPDCGEQALAVDIESGSSLAQAEAAIRGVLTRAAEREWLVLVDVFGATPCNATMAAVDGLRARVVAGVNVPMLWRTLCYANSSLDDQVERAVAGGAQGAMHVAVAHRQNQAAPAAKHDQDPHSHQQ